MKTFQEVEALRQATKKVAGSKDEAKLAKIEAIERELEAVEYLPEFGEDEEISYIETGKALAGNNNKRNGDDKIAVKGFQAYKADLIAQSKAVLKADKLGVLDSVLKRYHTPKK
jgi:hypothetical protein